jgi:hypothetical protein
LQKPQSVGIKCAIESKLLERITIKHNAPIAGTESCHSGPAAEWIHRDKDFRFAYSMAGVLLASGVFHLLLLAVTGADWEGSISPRKPALFGISAGLTAWSIVWVLTKVFPRRGDGVFANVITVSLVLEVALITMQYWRGVPSHFNHSTRIDTVIELVMLILILEVTLGIFWLTIRCHRLPKMDAAMAVALRGGMWLLLISCGLGIGISLLGTLNQLSGDAPERWGRAGVLKYPHGVALHAIQTLPILAWFLGRLQVPRSEKLVFSAVIAQTMFLCVAIRQTALGRARFDMEPFAMMLFGIAVLFSAFPVVAMVAAVMRLAMKRNR